MFESSNILLATLFLNIKSTAFIRTLFGVLDQDEHYACLRPQENYKIRSSK